MLEVGGVLIWVAFGSSCPSSAMLAARLNLSRGLKQKSLRLPSLLGRMPLLWASPCVASALEAAKHMSGWWAVPMPANSKATTRPQTHDKIKEGAFVRYMAEVSYF